MLEWFTPKELLIFVFSVGVFVAECRMLKREFKREIEFLQEEIEELKEETKKTNRVKERLIISEEHIKTIWRRIDELREDLSAQKK